MKYLLALLLLALAASPLPLKSSISPDASSDGEDNSVTEPDAPVITDNQEGGPVITDNGDGGISVIYYSFNSGSKTPQPKPSATLQRKFRGSLRGACFTSLSHGAAVNFSLGRHGVLSGAVTSGGSRTAISGSVGSDGRIMARLAGGGMLKGRLQNGVIVGGINGGPCQGSLLAAEVRH